MKVLLDTNVVLDVLLDRKDFSSQAKQIFHNCIYGIYEGCLSASAITDIFYMLSQVIEHPQSEIKKLLNVVTVLDVTLNDCKYALDLGLDDYEDAVIYSVAKNNKIDIIVTRNTKDFPKTNYEIQVLEPKEFLELYK